MVRDVAGNFIERLQSEKPVEDDDDAPLMPAKNEQVHDPANLALDLVVVKDPKAVLKGLQATELDLKLLADECKQIKYCVPLSADIETQLPRFGSIIKGVEKLVRMTDKDLLNIPEAQRLEEKVAKLNERADELKTWASKFGVECGAKKRRL